MKNQLYSMIQLLGLGLAATLSPAAHAATPPTIICPAASVLECTSSNGAPAVVQSTVSDADGDALMVIWTVNGLPVATNIVASGLSTNAVTLSLSAQFGFGTNDLTVGVTDDGTNVVMCSTTIVVVDTTPPVIEEISVNPSTLWPPNHKLKPVQVRVRATDACGPVTWEITSIESNEAIDGRGDGSTSPDWVITAPHKASVRAERAGPGTGRIYTLHVGASDMAGNATNTTITVRVPHDRGNGRAYHDKHDFEDDDDQGSANGKGKGKGKAKVKGNGNGNGNGNGHGHGH